MIYLLMAACDCLCLVDASLQVFQQQVSAVDRPEVHAVVPLSHLALLSFKSLLLINLKIQSNLRLPLFSHFGTASVSKLNTASG